MFCQDGLGWLPGREVNQRYLPSACAFFRTIDRAPSAITPKSDMSHGEPEPPAVSPAPVFGSWVTTAVPVGAGVGVCPLKSSGTINQSQVTPSGPIETLADVPAATSVRFTTVDLSASL